MDFRKQNTMADGKEDNVGEALLTNSDSVAVQIVPTKTEEAATATAPAPAVSSSMSSEAEADLAIRLTGAYKSYGRGGGKTPVLLGLGGAATNDAQILSQIS